MPRANRLCMSGQIWHITHRCHEQAWLLRFSTDRDRWLFWLHQARKRYGLVVLNYIVTSNHIHLLVQDQGNGEICRSMQLVAGRTAQEHNKRKNRRGAFWEDRYHATAVQNDSHFLRCVTYIDLNMVRAGVVNHPRQWKHSGLFDLTKPRVRYQCVDQTMLMSLLGQPTIEQLRRSRLQWIETELERGDLAKQAAWSNSVAVGNEAFLQTVLAQIKKQSPGRKIQRDEDLMTLREERASYNPFFALKASFKRFYGREKKVNSL